MICVNTHSLGDETKESNARSSNKIKDTGVRHNGSSVSSPRGREPIPILSYRKQRRLDRKDTEIINALWQRDVIRITVLDEGMGHAGLANRSK